MAEEARPLWKSLARKIALWFARITVAFVVLSVLWVLLYRVMPVPVTSIMVRDLMNGKDVKYDWVAMDDISAKLGAAAIASEDGRFCAHFGFDFEAMGKAAIQNAKGKKLKGGSTISQQVAKNAFLWPQRSYVRKGLEAWFTVLIETLWPKHRIMEVYLNIIEWGPGIYGAEAASQHFYGKSVKKLTNKQAARLVSVLPSPIKNSPVDMSARFAKKAKRVRNQLPAVANGFADCIKVRS